VFVKRDWKTELRAALGAFNEVLHLANAALRPDQIEVTFLDAPHRPPTSLPAGKMAVYGYWGEGEWLKIGLAGPKSKARYTSQHYRDNSTPSTLAKSLRLDLRMKRCASFDPSSPGEWIRGSCHRVNVLVPANAGRDALALLEAFLHVRLKPRYER
jgi:hypothetical protein